MEYTLPDEYKDENELERQRKIHDSLIAMGLQLISDSYLDVLGDKAEKAGLPFERKMMDGKHYKVLVEDAQATDYDLVIMGALGMGQVKDSQLGSVTERFVRKVSKDTLIIRNTDALKDQQARSWSGWTARRSRSTASSSASRSARRWAGRCTPSPSTTRICTTRCSTASSA